MNTFLELVGLVSLCAIGVACLLMATGIVKVKATITRN